MMRDWNWEKSLKEFKLGIKFNPNYSTAHHWYSEWLSFNGRFKEAIIEITKAIKLDPLSAAIIKDKGLIYYYFRDYDNAIEYATKALELDPQLNASFRLISLAYLEKGMYLEALKNIEQWAKLRGTSAETNVGLGLCFAYMGRREDSLKIINNINKNKSLTGNTERGIALIYAALGEKDLTFEWMGKAIKSRAESACLIKIDPKLDAVRDDPRFSLLLKES
jgi:tetratricopeptide (TPR) repeat protein